MCLEGFARSLYRHLAAVMETLIGKKCVRELSVHLSTYQMCWSSCTLPGTLQILKAEEFLANQPDTLRRFSRVATLTDGFETPYGLELLSSVHWVAATENQKT